MINKQILLDKHRIAEGLFNLRIDEYSPIEGYTLKNRQGLSYLQLWFPDGKYMMDSPDYITIYSKELLDIEFNSILILGLGLGVQPYVCQDFAQVDVLEIDQNVIDINNQLGFLNENVNIIMGDVFTYTPNKTYDVIVFDIIWTPLSEELSNQLIEQYLPFVNEGGFLYIPINKDALNDKVKIIK
jgi:protein-L-isoaspartate O-methyltransferase